MGRKRHRHHNGIQKKVLVDHIHIPRISPPQTQALFGTYGAGHLKANGVFCHFSFYIILCFG